MVKFKRYTEDEFDNFIGDSFLEDEHLWDFIKERDVNLNFDDSKGILTIKIKYQESDIESDEEDALWN